MSYNGSGTFLINTAGQPVVSGTVISSTAFNALTADLATGLSTAITKDGQTTVTANIPMSTYKFTGLGVGSAATDSANLSQVQSTVTKLLNSVSGADTITATASPTLAAYAAGQMFYFVAAGDNTTSVTLNIDSLGAKAVTRDGATALAAADIKSGEVVVVVYDGTRFQVVSQLNSAGDARFANVSIASSLYVGGVSTFVGNAGFSANVSIASALSVGGVAAITGATTIGGNLTLSGGTANGVLYLNGSKVATSGSALTFDGTNLGVNCTATALTNYRGLEFAGTTATTGGFLRMRTSDSSINSLDFTDSNGRAIFTTTNHPIRFGTNDVERMRLDSSGNLGIGTASPAGKVDSVSNATAAYAARASTTGANQTVNALNAYNADASLFALAKYNAVQHIWGYAGVTEGMRLDASGNLGLGVTPSAWTSLNVFQASRGSVAATTAEIDVNHNAYFDGAWKYIANGFATNHYQANGAYVWRTAPSGTAGNAISFTQAMTLDSSGNLGIGTASPAYRLDVQHTTNGIGMRLRNTSTGVELATRTDATTSGIDAGNAPNGMTFSLNTVEGMRLTSTGLGIGTASPSARLHVAAAAADVIGWFDNSHASTPYGLYVDFSAASPDNNSQYFFRAEDSTAVRCYIWSDGDLANHDGVYGTISDERLKQDIVDAGSQWDDLKAVRFRKYRMKTDVQANPDSPAMLGVVAQELEAVCPGLVDEHTDTDGETTKTVKSSILLMKAAVALQEAMARIETLEAKVAALESK